MSTPSFIDGQQPEKQEPNIKEGVMYSLFIMHIEIPVQLMWRVRGWCGRGGSGKRCDGERVCEREGVNSVVNTVIVWIGSVAGVWEELGKANGRKRAVVAKAKGYNWGFLFLPSYVCLYGPFLVGKSLSLQFLFKLNGVLCSLM